jgi:hypothetical protein
MTPDLQKLLDTARSDGLIPKIRKEFSKKGLTPIKRAIVQDMIIGISPVNGVGKWVKYSQSYKDVIDGKATFRKGKSGKTLVTNKKDEEFFRRSSPTKLKSPVNLRHSGGLHKSLFTRTYGGVKARFRLIIGFEHFLALIHNNQGAGKPKVIRRMLPTEKGEKFNKTITKAILKQLDNAASTIAKQFNRR